MSETGRNHVGPRAWRPSSLAFAAVLAVAGTEAGRASAQGWPGYARDPQHTSTAGAPSQLPERVRWKTSVDLAPQYSGGSLLTHYGSPVITRVNNVMVPVKVTSTGAFRVESRRGSDGGLNWQMDSDYVLPPHNWIPPFGPALTPKDRSLVVPAAGGTVFFRDFPDANAGAVRRLAFYGLSSYNQNPAAFANAIRINTPIACDRLGNLYFGYVSNGVALPGYPSGIPSGLARISASGVGSFVAAPAMSGDASSKKVVHNCSPALSNDGTKLYVAVNNIDPASSGGFGHGHLCVLDSTTLAKIAGVPLRDPRSNTLAAVSDDGTATPTVGPDGDVYFGVLEDNFPSNHARGWLLHFDGVLGASKTPASFGWDLTPSVVPATSVAGYAGTSSYLLLIKFNNYAGAGGNGQNRIALVDPKATMTDPISGQTVMNVVISVLGVTPDPEFNIAGAVREWCINSAAVDPANHCAVVNSEDGRVYRWNFDTNALSAGLTLAAPTGEAYTPTLIGPDGAVYAINNATLNCCVAN